MRCHAEPTVTITLRYGEREVVIVELLPTKDPNLLELCEDHVAGMTPPVGWVVRDDRTTSLVR
jgi:hypothetical protein